MVQVLWFQVSLFELQLHTALVLMDRWVNRLLDEDENELRSRTCLIADYVRCLRVLGFSHPALEGVWRQLSLTLDPLASP